MRARRVLVCCFVAFLVPLTFCQSAATPGVKLSAQNLDALDTSFSRMLANAMQSSKQATNHKATASLSKYEEDEDRFPFKVYGPNLLVPKPTLGDWFTNLLEDLEKEIDAQDEEYVRPHHSYPRKGSHDSHHSYDDPHDHHDSYHQDHDSYHQDHDSYGPDHDEQYGYKPRRRSSYGYQGKSDDACVQETARSKCQTAVNNDIKYISSLSCCSTPYGNQHYGQQPSDGPRYYGQHPSDGPRHSRPYSYTVNKAKTSSSSSSGESSVAIAAAAGGPFKTGKPTKTAGLPAKLAHYDPPRVFYPRGGNAECLWSIAYHDSVEVVSGTEQIGVATATCHFNGTMDHCASPLCDGLTLTISADVYTTYAVSRYGPVPPALDAVAPSLDDTCSDPEWDFGFNGTSQTAPRISSPSQAADTLPVPVKQQPTPAQAAQPDVKTPPAAADKPAPAPAAKKPQPKASDPPAAAKPAPALAAPPKTTTPGAAPAPTPAAADPKPKTPAPAPAAAKPAPAAADPNPKASTPAAAAPAPTTAPVAAPKPAEAPKAAAPPAAQPQPKTPTPAAAGTPAPAALKPKNSMKSAIFRTGAVSARTSRHVSYRDAKAAAQHKRFRLHPAKAGDKRAGDVQVSVASLQQHYDGPMYGDEDYFMFADTIHQKNTEDSGLYGGQATIIAGVITSITGIKKGVEYHRGMVEHVVRFEGTKLTAAEYEALPYDTPHIFPGKYKIVFMEDEHRY